MDNRRLLIAALLSMAVLFLWQVLFPPPEPPRRPVVESAAPAAVADAPELEDAGFDYSVVCEFRARLLASGAERRLLAQLLALRQAHKLVQAWGAYGLTRPMWWRQFAR